MTTYTFNTGTAKHLFCSVCGIKSFYVPRSHPDGFSVNARCLDPGTIEDISDLRTWNPNVRKCNEGLTACSSVSGTHHFSIRISAR